MTYRRSAPDKEWSRRELGKMALTYWYSQPDSYN